MAQASAKTGSNRQGSGKFKAKGKVELQHKKYIYMRWRAKTVDLFWTRKIGFRTTTFFLMFVPNISTYFSHTLSYANPQSITFEIKVIELLNLTLFFQQSYLLTEHLPQRL